MDADIELVCPECGKDDFNRPQGRGAHRRYVHGVTGKTTTRHLKPLRGKATPKKAKSADDALLARILKELHRLWDAEARLKDRMSILENEQRADRKELKHVKRQLDAAERENAELRGRVLDLRRDVRRTGSYVPLADRIAEKDAEALGRLMQESPAR